MSEAEWLTRKKRIDTRLKHKGRKLLPFSPGLELTALDRCAVEELPTGNGPADYALFVGGQCLGIVEAKKVSVNPQNVLEQAKTVCAGSLRRSWSMEGLPGPVSLCEQRGADLASRYALRKACLASTAAAAGSCLQGRVAQKELCEAKVPIVRLNLKAGEELTFILRNESNPALIAAERCLSFLGGKSLWRGGRTSVFSKFTATMLAAALRLPPPLASRMPTF
ncbi:hypothetical protein BH20VER3_BH20VER3_17010 [soil metagenome]